MKVRQRVILVTKYLLSSITIATGSIMPVDRVLLIELHSRRKVLDSLVILQKAIPDQSTSIEGRGILAIQFNNLVEIFKGELKSIAAHFLTDGAQVVDSLDVGSLQLYGTQVVFLRFCELASLIPTEGPIVVCLEMVLIKLDSPRVVSNCGVKVALLAIGKATIMVEIGLSWLYLDCGGETLDCLVEVTSSIE